jgi:hypothetical protein
MRVWHAQALQIVDMAASKSGTLCKPAPTMNTCFAHLNITFELQDI